MTLTCTISGHPFEVSDFELALRTKLNAPLPKNLPQYTFRHLTTFWPHFSLHSRKSDFSGKEIVSVYDTDCPYPVWHSEEWAKSANPPAAEVDFSKPFFNQLWELFQKCPIPHNIGLGNENCEYTDDWWYSKNGYLCHSGLNCQDTRYCYRCLRVKDSQFAVYTFDSELCFETVNCMNCYNLVYSLHSKNCRDSAFLFDCKNVTDSLFCWNLRNKQYCFQNKQLTKEEFLKVKATYDFSSRALYEKAKAWFHQLIDTQAWWKNLDHEETLDSSGNFLQHDKNCQNCFFVTSSEDCVNIVRGHEAKDTLDATSPYGCELVYMSALVQDQSYDIRYCFNLNRCRFMEYSAYCLNSENCFGCCGLVNKKYCIFNKQYTREEYEAIVPRLRQKITDEGLEGQFFPAYFAPTSYDESLAGVFFPLTTEQQQQAGFRVRRLYQTRQKEYLSPNHIGDNSQTIDPDITQSIFWDEEERRPFSLHTAELRFAATMNVPVPNFFYTRRLKELYSLMFFNGSLRATTCALSGEKLLTNLPPRLDGRIVNERAYLEKIV